MTHGNQTATTRFEVDMDGDGSSANVISRSVARIIQNRFLFCN